MYPISRFAEMHIIASPEGPQSLVGSLGPDTKEICAARLSRPKSETLPVVFFLLSDAALNLSAMGALFSPSISECFWGAKDHKGRRAVRETKSIGTN